MFSCLDIHRPLIRSSVLSIQSGFMTWAYSPGFLMNNASNIDSEFFQTS